MPRPVEKQRPYGQQQAKFISIDTEGMLTDDGRLLLWQFPDADTSVLTSSHQSIVVSERESVDSAEMSSLDGDAAGCLLVHVVYDCTGIY
jgi:hypothetical protein